MPLTVSPAGRAAIRQREGCRLTAYRDSKGIPTIGVGHVDATLPVTSMGMCITSDRADALLAADLGAFETAINATVRVSLTQNQFDALASLAFNIGVGGFKGSTVVRRLNAGDYAGAADAILLWNKPAALIPRRAAERAQFLMLDRSTTTQIATTAGAPVLNGIIGKINQAAADQARAKAGAAPAVLSPGPLVLPAATPTRWDRFVSFITGKAA